VIVADYKAVNLYILTKTILALARFTKMTQTMENPFDFNNID